MKVTAREGHHPKTPGGFPFSSDNRQYSHFSSAYIKKEFNISWLSNKWEKQPCYSKHICVFLQEVQVLVENKL